ncbi:MAG: hypothetical protein J0H57_06640 [Rhodospirillales bacterium]|nr:hypothetical protein [Rhodospirillales bacterium]
MIAARSCLREHDLRSSFRVMLGRLTHLLLSLIVALATTMSVGARAMPMSAGMTGAAIQRHCPNCPHDQTGSHSGKMPACQVLACASAIAVLPAPALLPTRILVRAAYLMAIPVRWTGAALIPDPFPPRPIALV